MEQPLYFDNCATTACDPRVIDKMMPYFGVHYGNAASNDHQFGWAAKDAVDNSRLALSKLIGCAAGEIIFTSGATESINLALKGVAHYYQDKQINIMTSAVEHKAVLDTCDYLVRADRATVTYLRVDSQGRVALEELEDKLTRETKLVALQLANNETGVVHDLQFVGKMLRSRGILLFCDATQAVGKIPVNVVDQHIDLLAFSAHKMYGPKGVGALYVRKEIKAMLSSQLHGGNQETGLRSGTLNTPGIVGFGEAARLCNVELNEEGLRLQAFRSDLEDALLSAFPGLSVNGAQVKRLPHVINFTIPGVNAEVLLLSLANYVALGRGSACSSVQRIPSHVLQAMGADEHAAYNSIRLSMGRFTQQEELPKVITLLKNAVQR